MTTPPLPPDEQSIAVEQARAVMQTHGKQLLNLPNVVGLGVGLRQTGGEWTDTVVLVVMVTQKLPLEALSAEERIPSEIDGVPIDVQETGSFAAPG
ncbi:MAG: hypothetical protein RBT34_06750 [Anaerolineaceae bacterium]|jgi:hypothetical protein|nr:hypothetical protein [Anaerolineaceae bacterium]